MCCLAGSRIATVLKDEFPADKQLHLVCCFYPTETVQGVGGGLLDSL